MRIVPGAPGIGTAATSAVAEVTRTESETAPAAAASTSASESLQSAVLQPGLAAMRELPDIDHAKVALLRDALAKGQLPFDAGKLAALIESYHRSGK